MNIVDSVIRADKSIDIIGNNMDIMKSNGIVIILDVVYNHIQDNTEYTDEQRFLFERKMNAITSKLNVFKSK